MATRNFGARIKNFFRKQVVSLKRNPQRIPFLAIVIVCLIFCSGLTAYSNSCVAVYSEYVKWVNYSALGVFIIMLLSLLTIFTFLFAYGKDNNSKTKKIIMLTVVYIFLAIQINVAIFIYYVFYYRTNVTATGVLFEEVERIAENGSIFYESIEKPFTASPIQKSADIAKSMKLLTWVMVFDFICVLLLALQPVYAKLLRKINTTVNSEDFQIDELDETVATIANDEN